MTNQKLSAELDLDDSELFNILNGDEVKKATLILMMRKLLAVPTENLNDQQCRSTLASVQSYATIYNFQGIVDPETSKPVEEDIEEDEFYPETTD